jgi:hypothetical protein
LMMSSLSGTIYRVFDEQLAEKSPSNNMKKKLIDKVFYRDPGRRGIPQSSYPSSGYWSRIKQYLGGNDGMNLMKQDALNYASARRDTILESSAIYVAELKDMIVNAVYYTDPRKAEEMRESEESGDDEEEKVKAKRRKKKKRKKGGIKSDVNKKRSRQRRIKKSKRRRSKKRNKSGKRKYAMHRLS